MSLTRRFSTAALAALTCGFLASAVAKSDLKFNIESMDAFDQQVSSVHAEMSNGGQYSEIGREDRAALDVEFGRMRSLLERKFSTGRLEDRDQVELANAQEHANAILTRNDGDRLICTWERRSGSNFKYKSCMTASQRDGERRRSQDGYQNAIMKGGGSQQRGN